MIPPRLEIRLVGGLDPDDSLIAHLAEELQKLFSFSEVGISELPLDDRWRSPGGDQLESGAIIDSLIGQEEERSDALSQPSWILAVTDVDLGAPGRDYVFGEATLGGRWAVVSTARLVDAPDGTSASRLPHRLLVEAAHELGHLAGYDHCRQTTCVMHPVQTAAGVDAKNPDFCGGCAPTTHNLTGNEP